MSKLPEIQQFIFKKEKKVRPTAEANGLKVYIETYGCQMNVADSELIVAILSDEGYTTTDDYKQADIVFMNTCSIRDNAEQRVRNRLHVFKHMKKSNPDLLIGILGCMAERLKEQLLEEEKLVDLVVGPDAYRNLPMLIAKAETGQKAVNVLLSREETATICALIALCPLHEAENEAEHRTLL